MSGGPGGLVVDSPQRGKGPNSRAKDSSCAGRAETENEDDRRLVTGGMVAEGEKSGSRGNQSQWLDGPPRGTGRLMVNVNPKC
jgi:hypothetical protein